MSESESVSGTTSNDLSGSAGHIIQARDVAGGVHFHTSAAAASGPLPQQLPGDVRGFVNRFAEMNRLSEVLFSDSSEADAVRVAVIVGTAGVGKTSLALRWAHRMRAQFPDGQLYVNLRGYDPGAPVSASEALERFLQALGIPTDRIPSGEEPRSEQFRSLIAERRMLIVLDNAATVGQVRPLLPGTAASVVLVTSRSRLSSLVVRDGARRVSVRVLAPEESVALLRHTVAEYRTEDDDAELAQLAAVCAQLPLALRIAAERAAARPRMSLRDLISDLRDESGLWDALSSDDEAEADAVRTIFAWSYRALSPEAALMFRRLGLHPGPEFGLQAAAVLAETNVGKTRRLLDILVDAHLLEETDRERYQFHDLLRAYAADQAGVDETADTREACLKRLLSWYLHMAAAAADTAPRHMSPFELVPLGFAAEIPRFTDSGAREWYRSEHTNLMLAVRTASEMGAADIAWQIPTILVILRDGLDPRDTWHDIENIALKAVQRIGDEYGEGHILHSLAIADRLALRLNRASEEYDQAGLRFAESGDHLAEAYAVNGSGLVAMHLRHFEIARKNFSQALTVARRMNDQLLEAVALMNLGTIASEMNDLTEAEPRLEMAAIMFRTLAWPFNESQVLMELAKVLRLTGRLTAAREALLNSLQIAANSDNPTMTAWSLNELGHLELAESRAEDALATSHSAAVAFKRLNDPRAEAIAWRVSGQALYALGRYEEAEAFHRRAAAAHRRLDEYWSLAQDLDHLALTLDIIGKHQQALDIWSDAIATLHQLSDHVATTLRQQIEVRLTDRQGTS